MRHQHDNAVAIISADVRQFYEQREPFRIYHGSTNSTRPASHDRRIDTSGLTNILNVNVESKVVEVEPNVPMDRLVEETLKYGLLPPVVMEFPGITVGGGFAGTAGESSSFKHGFFDRIVNWTEMVLANGDVVTTSETENSDLFHGAAGTLGTIGVTTLLELKLIDARKYVEVTYHPVCGMSDVMEKIQEATDDPSNDYLDGILFSLNRGVIVTGRLTDELEEGTKVQRFARATDPWYYIYVSRIQFNGTSPVREAVPLVDYLFRYDRGAFWVGAYAFKYFHTPFNRVTRWLLDTFMHTRVMYHALHESGQSKQYIIQDLALPYSTASEFVEYVDEEFKIYPIWLCPLKQSPDVSLHPHSSRRSLDSSPSHDMLLNVGVWGPGSRDSSSFVQVNRRLEAKVRELSGMKWLYAMAYYTEEEFWEIYDRKWYDGLRARYDATSLPSVFDKVKTDVEGERRAMESSWKLWILALFWSIWPLSGLYGVYRAAIGGDYLLTKRTTRKIEAGKIA